MASGDEMMRWRREDEMTRSRDDDEADAAFDEADDADVDEDVGKVELISSAFPCLAFSMDQHPQHADADGAVGLLSSLPDQSAAARRKPGGGMFTSCTLTWGGAQS